MSVSPERSREYSRRYLEDPEHREANRLRARRHYAANREHRKAQSRAYYAGHREETRITNIARRFGLSRDAYLELVAAQGGRCAICRCQGLLAVDHNHRTRIVRGLLCGNCNFLIGHGKDDPTILRAAAAYLESTDA